MQITPDTELHTVLGALVATEVRGQDSQPILDQVAHVWATHGRDDDYMAALLRVETCDVGMTLRHLADHVGKSRAIEMADVLLRQNALAVAPVAKASWDALPPDQATEETLQTLCRGLAENVEFGFEADEGVPDEETRQVIRRRWRP